MARVDRKAQREQRRVRVRGKVFGTAERPRLNVFRSEKHMYAQIIIDETGDTIAAASTLDPAIRDAIEYGGNVDAARKVGELVARRALDKGIKQVVFDRAGYAYHGRVAAVADAAREAGLEF